MRKLSGTDALFLYAETANTPQHVGSIQYLEVSDEMRPTFFEQLRALYQQRIHLLPYLTSRLQAMPWNVDHPVWVRHTQFNLDDHFHHLTLEAPGTIAQLEAKCGELYESVLDRSRPLWETWVIDGLENGQVAVFNKTHHACLDGMASVSAMEILADYSETPREVEPPAADFWEDEDASYGTLMHESWVNLARYNMENWLKWPQRVAATNRVIQRALLIQRARPDTRRVSRPALSPKAPWNAAVSGKRSLAGTHFSLTTIKAIAKQTGTKINDVILAITADALNRYLSRHKSSVAGKMIASCPVSLRQAGDQDMNNQVTMMMVSLENDIADPIQRLKSIHRAANSAKELLEDMNESTESDFGSPFLPAIAQSMARSTGAGTFANFGTHTPATLVVSNVMGVRQPLYSVGARLIGSTPLSLVVHGAGLNVTVSSYLDRFDLGITAAANVVPDAARLRDDFDAAYRSLIEQTVGEVSPQGPRQALTESALVASQRDDTPLQAVVRNRSETVQYGEQGEREGRHIHDRDLASI